MNECSFNPCERQAISDGLCRGHYTQQYRGTELRPLRVHKRLPSPGPGLKTCTRCGLVLDAEKDFYPRQSGGPLFSWCKECAKKYTSEYRRKAVEQRKAEHEELIRLRALLGVE